MWNQVREVTALNLRSLPQRLGSSAVTVLGIAGVVVVFVGILSMAQGFQRTMMTGGDPLTAIVLRSGASSETGSLLGLDTVRLVKEAPGIARENGRSQASAEFAVVVRHAVPLYPQESWVLVGSGAPGSWDGSTQASSGWWGTSTQGGRPRVYDHVEALR